MERGLIGAASGCILTVFALRESWPVGRPKERRVCKLALAVSWPQAQSADSRALPQTSPDAGASRSGRAEHLYRRDL